MAEQMQRTVFVKAGALLECKWGYLVCLGLVDLLCLAPRGVPAGSLTAGLPLALAVTPGHVQTHIFGGPPCLPALPSLQGSEQQCQPGPELPHMGPELPLLPSLGWVMSCALRCCGMRGRRDEGEISLGTNVKLNKMRVCISQPQPDCAI